MEGREVQRRLAAILSADVAGYSRLMAHDEVATVRTITAYRNQIGLLAQGHAGRVVDATGDNLLAEFPSALDAVRCALEAQLWLRERNEVLPEERRMHFRLGAHLGDVVVDGERIYGDGVNIAARLQALASPGGLCISAAVYELIQDKLALTALDLGERELKNIPRPVHAYQITVDARAQLALARLQTDGADALPLPGLSERPALAVLPLANMSERSEIGHFADGLAEDLITLLSRWNRFPVVARNSSFAYGGRAVDVKQVSRELGVRYVLEGSVREASNRVRVNAQLIDASSGHHLWAERYDRDLGDIFAVQDDLVATIAAAVGRVLAQGVGESVLRRTAPDSVPARRGRFVSQRPALVDRTSELAQLRQAIARALRGHGSLVLLGGEAGIGKSHLGEAALAYAQEQGAVVLVGRCYEGGAAPAYWPWVEILGGMARDAQLERVVEQQLVREPLLSHLLPGGPPATQAPLGTTSGESGQFLLFDGVQRLLATASQQLPVVLLLEDLHWADRSSLRLLEFLAKHVSESGLCVIATYRADEAVDSALAGSLALLSREPSALRLGLSGLLPSDSEQLVRRIAGPVPEAWASAVHERAAGNALFVSELARSYGESSDPAALSGDQPIGVPATVREVIERRVARLPSSVTAVLRIAAVLDREPRARLLAELCSLSPAVLDRVLEPAVRSHVLERAPAGDGYRFAHALIRDALYASLPRDEASALHARVAATLERLYGPHSERHATQLAYHLLRGLPTSSRERAVAQAAAAARLASRRFAHDEAMEWNAQALAALRGGETVDRALECELLLSLAESCHAAGQLWKGWEAGLEAAEIARERNDARSFARAAMSQVGSAIVYGATAPAATPLFEEALRRLGDQDPRLRVLLLSRLAALPVPGREQQAQQIARAALACELAEQSREPDLLASALSSQHAALSGPEHVGERTACAGRLVSLAERVGDPDVLLSGRYCLIVDYLEHGERERFLAEVKLHAEHSARHRLRLHRWRAARVRALLAVLDGRLQDAERLADEALRLALRQSASDAAHTYAAQIVQLRELQGRLGELEAQTVAFAGSYPDLFGPRVCLARTQVVLGRREQAQRALEQLALRGFQDLPQGPEWPAVVTGLALLCHELSDSRRAAELQARLEPYRDCNLVLGVTCFYGAGAYYLGLLAETQGRFELAIELHEHALSRHRGLQARPFEALSLHALSRVLGRSGEARDRDRSRRCADESTQLAAEIGMRLDP